MIKALLQKLVLFIFIGEAGFSFAQVNCDFSANKTSGCGTAEISFFDQTTGGPASWLWDFGDGNSSILQNPSHLYLAPGTYTVSLTATNGGGSDTETKNAFITVFPFPLSDFTQDDTVGCAPFTVNFTDSSFSSSGIVSWLWNFGDGYNDSVKNPQHIYSNPGTYSVTLYATDQNNCPGTKIKTGLITVLQPISAEFSLSSSFSCIAPFDAGFTNNSSAGSDISYLWDFGDGSATSSVQNPPTHTYTAFGIYPISLIVSNSAGCSDTSLKILTISSFSSSFSATDSSGCAPDTFIFSATNPSASSYQWSFPSGSPASSSAVNPSIIYSVAGTYDVTLIAGNSQGCSDTLTLNNFITVYPIPSVNFSASDSDFCAVPVSVDFVSLSPGAQSWNWTFTGGSPISSTVDNPTVTYSTEGVYNVSLNVADTNGCRNTATINNFIKITFPSADFTLSAIKGCTPLNVNFSDISSANPAVTVWNWNFGDPVSGAGNSSTLQTPLHVYNDTGFYSVQLIIINSDGCTDTIIKNNVLMVGMQDTADFSPKNSNGCHPLTVPFTNLSSSFSDEWNWTFTNGLTTYTSTSFNPTQIFTDTGYFDITLIASHHGCPHTLFVEDAVLVKPAKPIFNVADRVLCEKEVPYLFTFSNTSISAEKWTWKFGDGSADSIGFGPQPVAQTHTYQLPGIYPVWLIAENFSTGCIDSLSTTIGISDINVDFNIDTNTGCQPLPIIFTDTSATNSSIVSLMWKFGDGINTPAGMGTIISIPNTSGTFSQPQHIFSNSGYYMISLIITDSLLCSDTLTIDSLIEVKPLPDVNFTSDTSNGCTPLIVKFSDLSSSGAPLESWFWDFGNGNTDTIQNPGDTFNLRGQYSVKLVVTDTFNCTNDTVKTNYINATFPFPDFTVVNDTICNNSSSALTNISTPVTGLKYVWNFGDNSPLDTLKNPVHLFSVNSDSSIVLNISLTAKDSNGCKDSISKPIVISIPKAGFYAGAQNDSCPPFDALFIDSSSADIVSWYWNFGDNPFSITKTTPGAAHTYESAGFYDVSLIATNNIGCKDTLVRDSLIRVPGPGGSFTFSVDSMRCFTDVNFVATTFNANSLTWHFSDGNTSTGSSVTHRYETNGSYLPLLILKDNNNCEVFIKAQDTIVISTSTISASIKPDTNNIYPENNIIFTGSSSSPAPVALWEWNFGDKDSLISPSVNKPVHQYDNPGTYRVVLKITDSDSCSAIFDTLITIIEGIVVPTVFTPNGDGTNDFFTIRRNGMKEHYIVIFNRWGEMIFEHRASEINWSGKNFAGADVIEGTYFYILQSTNSEGAITEDKSYITIIR